MPRQGTLTANRPAFTATKPGAGPRHLVFAPNGRQAYVINEINSTITLYAYDPTAGVLTELQTVSLLPQGFTGANTAAEIAVHPSGKFLYGSNRGDDSIAVFGIDSRERERGFDLPAACRHPGENSAKFRDRPLWKAPFRLQPEFRQHCHLQLGRRHRPVDPSGQVLEAPSPVCVKFVP